MDVSKSRKSIKNIKNLSLAESTASAQSASSNDLTRPLLHEVTDSHSPDSTRPDDLEGSQLIDTLVSLTGLPESFAHNELEQILSLSGHDASTRADLTLDDLRQALLTYMEALCPPDEDLGSRDISE